MPYWEHNEHSKELGRRERQGSRGQADGGGPSMPGQRINIYYTEAVSF